MDIDKMVTIKEYLNIIPSSMSERTIRRQIQKGEIPGVKVNKKWYIHLAEIDDRLAQFTLQKAKDLRQNTGLSPNDINMDKKVTIKEFIAISPSPISKKTARRLIRKGKLTAIKVEEKWYIQLEENNPLTNNPDMLQNFKKLREGQSVESFFSGDMILTHINIPASVDSLVDLLAPLELSSKIKTLIEVGSTNSIDFIVKKHYVYIEKYIYQKIEDMAKRLHMGPREVTSLLFIESLLEAKQEASQSSQQE